MSIETQGAEFDAAAEFAHQVRRISLIPVVNDGYPAVRQDYESALRVLLRVCKENGRHFPDRPRSDLLTSLCDSVLVELSDACANWPPFNSAHEGYAVLLEEMTELWEHVTTKQKNRNLAAMRKEALQVAAMGLRFAMEVCDETRGRK